MSGKFIPAAEAEREQLDWGALAWLSRPQTTGAKDLVVIEVSLSPGGGHNFHKHPEQEEVIYVIDGTVEQWLRDEKRMLSSGDFHISFPLTRYTLRLTPPPLLRSCLRFWVHVLVTRAISWSMSPTKHLGIPFAKTVQFY